jgi:transposase
MIGFEAARWTCPLGAQMDASPKGENEEAGAARATRRVRTVEEKLAILREVAKPGASVAAVARKHGMNANLLFGWRRLHRQGVLENRRHAKAVPLLPVKIERPTLLPTVKASSPPKAAAATRERGVIEIEFPGGIRVRLHGTVDALLLRRVLKTLRR